MSTSVGTVSPERYRSMRVSSSLSVMIPSMSVSRSGAIRSTSDSADTGDASRVPEE